MLQIAFLALISTVLASTLAGQIPLTSSQFVSTAPRDDSEDLAQWGLAKLPDPHATDHLVFETAYSLLQHWPNTRMRNGHSIVPGIIQKGTLLYHGRGDKNLPSGPEWVSTDPEHSYLFCRGGHSEERCWQLTLMTNRPLKVAYFDGSSAAKLPYGSMDTQDLVAWGEPRPDRVWDERRRISDLCEWGKDFGVDGIVRMELDFEVMLCNFSSGVGVVSFVEHTSRWAISPELSSSVSFEATSAGSRHNRLPGETRIQLDLSGLISFYDTQLAPSLVPIRVGQERWDHRVQNISSKDVSTLKSRLSQVFTRSLGSSSGIDWKTLIQVIVDRYAQHLELTHYILHSPTVDLDGVVDLANKTQYQLRAMLMPYLPFSAVPTNITDKNDLDWTAPIYKMCATAHTRLMESEIGSMTDSEKLLLQAVRGTTREICRVVTKMWAAGVYAGVDPSLRIKESAENAEINRLWRTWVIDLNHLMGWLDWNVWVKCNPACSFEEMCYLPTWPFGFPGAPGRGPPSLDHGRLRPEGLDTGIETIIERAQYATTAGPDDWVRPMPTCVRRIYP